MAVSMTHLVGQVYIHSHVLVFGENPSLGVSDRSSRSHKALPHRAQTERTGRTRKTHAPQAFHDDGGSFGWPSSRRTANDLPAKLKYIP